MAELRKRMKQGNIEDRVTERFKMGAKWNSMPINSLEKGARTLAKNLEKMGLKVDIEVFKTGPGGTQHYGPSFVELEITGTFLDADGDPDEAYTTIKFIAGGYGSVGDRDIGGSEGWRAMQTEGLRRIMRDLESQGWKPQK